MNFLTSQSENFMENKSLKCAEAQMLIRKPVTEVFEAFINPAITKYFWFTKSSGSLQEGKTITWEWEVYNVSEKIFVRKILRNKKISIEWENPVTTVDFDFEIMSNDSTYVTIEHCGFQQTGDDLLKKINDTTGGFTTVLDGLKAYLEHGINLNLIADKFPKKQMATRSNSKAV
jgi:uncharacterized protein YndB with AHSA1/START domain